MRSLKILLAVLIILTIMVLGYGVGHWEDIICSQYTEDSEGTAIVSEEDTVIYTWEMTKQSLVDITNSLIGDQNISEAIVNECTTQTADYKLCIKNVLGVANAESSMFKKWMNPSNNWFGWMYKGKKRRFQSVEESIKERVALYVKNGWANRKTWADWLKGNYCSSECKYWKKNYNSAVNKLIELGLD